MTCNTHRKYQNIHCLIYFYDVFNDKNQIRRCLVYFYDVFITYNIVDTNTFSTIIIFIKFYKLLFLFLHNILKSYDMQHTQKIPKHTLLDILL